MDKKPPSNKRRTVSLREIKWLILSLGLTGTILFWNMFSKEMNQDTAASASVAATPTQPIAGEVLEFSAMPTLIPYQSPQISMGASQNPAGGSQNPAPTPAPVLQAQVQAPAKIILSNNAPRPAAPAPVTRTRSSRP
jgi:hypothetical protein